MMTNEQLNEAFQHGIKYLGLDYFDHTEIIQDATASHDFILQFATKFSMHPMDGDIVGQMIDKLRDIEKSIQDSDLITSQIKTLEGKINNLTEENKELQKYKTYYELAKGLK